MEDPGSASGIKVYFPTVHVGSSLSYRVLFLETRKEVALL